MKKQTKGPIENAGQFPESRLERAFAEEPPLYLVPRLGRKRLAFVKEVDDGKYAIFPGGIDADDVSSVIASGSYESLGPTCTIETRSGTIHVVRGYLGEVEEKLFGEVSK